MPCRVAFAGLSGCRVSGRSGRAAGVVRSGCRMACLRGRLQWTVTHGCLIGGPGVSVAVGGSVFHVIVWKSLHRILILVGCITDCRISGMKYPFCRHQFYDHHRVEWQAVASSHYLMLVFRLLGQLECGKVSLSYLIAASDHYGRSAARAQGLHRGIGASPGHGVLQGLQGHRDEARLDIQSARRRFLPVWLDSASTTCWARTSTRSSSRTPSGASAGARSEEPAVAGALPVRKRRAAGRHVRRPGFRCPPFTSLDP